MSTLQEVALEGHIIFIQKMTSTRVFISPAVIRDIKIHLPAADPVETVANNKSIPLSVNERDLGRSIM